MMLQSESRTLLGSYALSEQLIVGDTLNNIKIFAQNPLIKSLHKKGYSRKHLNFLLECGNSKGYRIKNCGCGKKLVEFKFQCNNVKACFTCSKKRQKRLADQYLPYLNSLPQTRLKKVRFVSISPEHYSSLEEAWRLGSKSLKNFLRSKFAIANEIDGGLWIIQVTEHDNGWHFHFHLLSFSKYLNNRTYLDEFGVRHDSELVQQLKKSFGRELNVDIRLPKANFKNDLDRNKGILEYVLSYVSSFQDDFSSLDKYTDYLIFARKKKMINTFGCFFKNKPKKPEYVCKCCGQKITYSFDFKEIDDMLQKLSSVLPFFSKDPPPPVETIYIFPKKSDFSISETNLDLIRKVKEKLKGGSN